MCNQNYMIFSVALFLNICNFNSRGNICKRRRRREWIPWGAAATCTGWCCWILLGLQTASMTKKVRDAPPWGPDLRLLLVGVDISFGSCSSPVCRNMWAQRAGNLCTCLLLFMSRRESSSSWITALTYIFDFFCRIRRLFGVENIASSSSFLLLSMGGTLVGKPERQVPHPFYYPWEEL
jgi:hypothetical protein